jgi:hypothetical protein
MEKIRANRRYWAGDLFENGRWWAEMKGRPVLGIGLKSLRAVSTLAGTVVDRHPYHRRSPDGAQFMQSRQRSTSKKNSFTNFFHILEKGNCIEKFSRFIKAMLNENYRN